MAAFPYFRALQSLPFQVPALHEACNYLITSEIHTSGKFWLKRAKSLKIIQEGKPGRQREENHKGLISLGKLAENLIAHELSTCLRTQSSLIYQQQDEEKVIR